jgi:hypothetical protein
LIVIVRGQSWRGRKRVIGAGLGLAVTVAVTAAWPGAASAATGAPVAPTVSAASAATAVRLSAAPLGIDIAPWDSLYSSSATYGAVQSLLKAAGIGQIHYGGGVTADQYDWQTNTDIGNCAGTATSEFTAACAYSPALDFSLLSAHARALGAQTFATVNYGSGTPGLAAAWVKQAKATSGQAVAQWEIGNESYGCWEDNNWLAGAPENYAGYQPNVGATCPMNSQGLASGIATMASSYAANAGQYMRAMKAADPSAQLGVPWAFDETVPGAAVGGSDTWNNTVLGADARYISFVDAHWYPFGFPGDPGVNGNPTDQQIIQSVEQIPAEYAKIRAELNAYDPSASVTVGETGVSYLATTVPCRPAGALFAAGDALSWLAAGAKSVDWWPLDTNANLGNTCVNPEEAMFTSTGQPTTPYAGYLLASALARPGAQLSALATSDPASALAFQSLLPNGQVAVALINTSTSAPEKVSVATSLTGNLTTLSYSAGDQNAANTKIVAGTTTAGAVAGGVTLPAESILVLETLKPSALTLGTSSAGNTLPAGSKVTVKGTLTLNGTPAPAGVPVTIDRQGSGGGATSATLTARTGAGGTFAVTDVPPAHGSYVYLARYAASGYQPASRSVLVHVLAVRPKLTLRVSAASVKRGAKVTVTATLGAPHANKTLIIYAQPKGGGKKIIRHASVNSRGQLSVTITVKANTTFTVTFSGDTWYAPATATAYVKA